MTVWMAVMLALLAFSSCAMDAARQAAVCFASGVLPALLPMSVLGRLMPDRTKDEHSKTGLWFRTGIFACAAGSPAAAQRASAVRGRLTAREWEALLCLCGVMSPMFFTGTLAGWLHSAEAGRKLLVIHWLSAALTALLWYAVSRPQNAIANRQRTGDAQPSSLPQAVMQSAQAMLCVCGAMMVFAAAASLAQSLLQTLFPLWTAGHARELAVMKALMEIGGGCAAVIETCENPHALLGALCGFGGLSIWLQNLLFLDKSIRPVKLLAMRAVHGAVSYAIAMLLKPF